MLLQWLRIRWQRYYKIICYCFHKNGNATAKVCYLCSYASLYIMIRWLHGTAMCIIVNKYNVALLHHTGADPNKGLGEHQVCQSDGWLRDRLSPHSPYKCIKLICIGEGIFLLDNFKSISIRSLYELKAQAWMRSLRITEQVYIGLQTLWSA